MTAPFCLLVLSLFFQFPLVAPCAAQSEARSRPYVSRSLAETIRLYRLEYRKLGMSLVGVVNDEPSDPGSIATVVYTGEWRRIQGANEAALDLWKGVYSEAGADYLKMVDGYNFEVRFLEGGKSYWIPLQDVQLSCLPEELLPGDRVDLHVRLRGGVFVSGKSDYFFTVHEFDSSRPDGVTSVSSRASQFPSGRDPGVDIAVTTFPVSNLRAEPGYASETEVVRYLPANATLALVERVPRGAFFHVIHAESGDEGWVHTAMIDRMHTIQPREGGGFEAERTGGVSAPTLTIVNGTPKTLQLRLNGTLYVLASGASRELTLSAGTVTYYGWVAGAYPDSGSEEVRNGMRYSWKFYITTRPR